MKIIFLDYNGVLNSPYFLLQKKDQSPTSDFDPKCIDILAKICSEANAQVVVTSSWRFNKEARLFLLQEGVPIIDIVKPGERGKAIEHYLKNTTAKVDSYLIFDDETSDYSEEQMKHLICTRESFDRHLVVEYPYYMGLQEKHIKIAKAMLES